MTSDRWGRKFRWPDHDGTSTPGFELIALVAALGAALVLVRRRS